MPISLIPSFLYYCFVSSITPGPANLCSLSTALRHGRNVALRQWRGLFTGYFAVSVASAFVTYFVGSRFTEYVRYFAFVGAIYILWLAVHILRDNSEISENTSRISDEEKEDKKGVKEGTFLFGFFVQMTNVKIMISCLTELAGFVLPYHTDLKTLLLIACFLPFTGPMCNLVWLFAGVKLRTLFNAHRRLINTIMAVSLVICAVTMVVG